MLVCAPAILKMTKLVWFLLVISPPLGAIAIQLWFTWVVACQASQWLGCQGCPTSDKHHVAKTLHGPKGQEHNGRLAVPGENYIAQALSKPWRPQSS